MPHLLTWTCSAVLLSLFLFLQDEKGGLKVKLDRRGLVGMCNQGKNSNASQFFFTLGPCNKLTGKVIKISTPQIACVPIICALSNIATCFASVRSTLCSEKSWPDKRYGYRSPPRQPALFSHKLLRWPYIIRCLTSWRHKQRHLLSRTESQKVGALLSVLCTSMPVEPV